MGKKVKAHDTKISTHVVHEDNPWSERIPDHGGRVETPAFTKAKATMHKLVDVLKGFPFYGVTDPALGVHHG